MRQGTDHVVCCAAAIALDGFTFLMVDYIRSSYQEIGSP